MNNILSWDEVFMKTAQLFSNRSKDPSTKVGACISSPDKRLLSVGYNGAPNGFADDIFPWGKGNPNPLDNKHLFVIHAERNAILNFRGNNRELEGATIYVTHFPCNECAKEIIQSGITEVVYLHHYGDGITDEASKIMFQTCNISCRELSL